MCVSSMGIFHFAAFRYLLELSTEQLKGVTLQVLVMKLRENLTLIDGDNTDLDR